MTDEKVSIPSLVPAMILRDAVLFPKAMMPLRIFEERYRRMLDDALLGNRMFAVAGSKQVEDYGASDTETPCDIATVGLIRVSKKHDDGTSFILLQGIERVRVHSIHSESPYPILEVETIETEVDDSAIGLRDQLVVELKRNQELGGEVTDEIMDFLDPLEDDVSFVNLAAFSLCKQSLRKQAMLEVSSLGKRASMLLDDLMRENDRLSLLNKALGDIPHEDFDSN